MFDFSRLYKGLVGAGVALVVAVAMSVSARADTVESEPNDRAGEDDAFEIGAAFTGVFTGADGGGRDVDRLTFTVDEALAEERFDLRLAVTGGAAEPPNLRIILTTQDGRQLMRREGDGAVALEGLAPAPGVYGLQLSSNASEDAAYQLSLENRSARRPADEREPNDERADAAPFGDGARVLGNLSDGDTDYYSLHVEGEIRLWRIDANGAELRYLRYEDARGVAVAGADASEGRTLTLSSLLLAPGDHWFVVRGSGAYQIMATPTGPAPVEAIGGARLSERAPGEVDEIEPNDEAERAMLILLGDSRGGWLDRRGDQDFLRFSLRGEEQIALRLTGSAGGGLRAYLRRIGASREIARIDAADRPDRTSEANWRGVLPRGDYAIELRADEPLDEPWELYLDRVDFFDRTGDLEPDDEPWQARWVGSDLVVTGVLGVRETDWRRLPALTSAGVVTAVAEEGAPNLHLRDETRTELPGGFDVSEVGASVQLRRDRDTGEMSAEVPAMARPLLRITGDPGPYRIRLSLAGGPEAAPTPEIAMSLGLDHDALAAQLPGVQNITGAVQIENGSDRALDLDLAAFASNEAWEVQVEPAAVRLAPGDSAEAALEITAPAGLIADDEVDVRVAAYSDERLIGGAEGRVAALADAAPVAPGADWPLPEEMLGGMNVAAAAFGAQIESEPGLIDGIAASGMSVRWNRNEAARDTLTIDLAGEAAHPLIGVALSSRSGAATGARLRRFRIETSLDGETFEPALEDALSPGGAEQAFMFDAEREARFVRLIPLDTESGLSSNEIMIGELRVIAAPGRAADIAPEEGFNLLDRAFGGRVVYSIPYINAQTLLEADDRGARHWLARDYDGDVEVVVDFRAHRAARIASIGWTEESDAPEDELPGSVAVSASTRGCAGPWTQVGRLVRGEDGAIAPLSPAEPFWARCLRFSITPREGQRGVRLPDHIAAYEASESAEYYSVLGEWGDQARPAAYERAHFDPVAAALSARNDDDGDSETSPTPLALETTVEGSVSLGVDEDWYRIEAPPEAQTLRVTVRGAPVVRATASVRGPDGAEIPVSLVEDEGEMRIYEAAIGPGPHLIRVAEPPRSIAIVWDSSGSVSRFIPAIVNGVRSFSRFVEPGRDEANLFPFATPRSRPLLDEWSGDPATLFIALQNYPWDDGSSDLHGGVAGAAAALSERDGARAMIVLTDAATPSGDIELDAWRALMAARAQVFAIAIPSGSSGQRALDEAGMLQSYAGAFGGRYAYLETQSELEAMFQRISHELRAPARYQLSAEIGVEPPEPGTIIVTAPEGESVQADQAVAVLLDGSGSMLGRLDGQRRIDIARDVLREVLASELPDGALVSLRTIGETSPGSCDTRLALPLAPLDRAAFAQAVDAVSPVNLAKTPIAAALAAVREDLAEAPGRQMVLLLTDGEETCGGDPGAEIAGLRESGLDVQVNIVGFALDDETVREAFAGWARSGGGAYFDASDRDSLADAIARSVQAPFDVIDAAGQVVAQGMVGGEPVETAPGVYRVVVRASPERAFDDVAVSSGTAVTLEMD